MSATGAPSAEAFTRACEMYRGEWDARGSITVSLPADLAVELLARKGWTRDGRRGLWVSPDGAVRCWLVAEALQLVLVAEALEL